MPEQVISNHAVIFGIWNYEFFIHTIPDHIRPGNILVGLTIISELVPHLPNQLKRGCPINFHQVSYALIPSFSEVGLN